MGGTSIRSFARAGLAAAVAIVLVGACAAQDPGQGVDAGGVTTSGVGTSSTTERLGTVPASGDVSAADVDGPFCVALDRYLEVAADAEESVPGAMIEEPTADEVEQLRATYLPALEDLHAATPTQLREPVDFLLELVNSMLLPADDPGRSQVVIDLLAGGGVERDTFDAFMAFATGTCELDEAGAKALGDGLGRPTSNDERCTSSARTMPTVVDQDRLLTVEDVTSIEAFERNCPQVPRFSVDPEAEPFPSPCGGELPTVDLMTGTGSSYGLGFSQVVETLLRPGEADATGFVDALRSSMSTGCPGATTTEANGSTSTTSDVVVHDLGGIDDPHVAFTANIATQLSFGTQTGLPIDLRIGVAVVQHEDELLVLTAIGQDPVPPEDLEALAVAAVRRAGW